jgi:hypothetical protein
MDLNLAKTALEQGIIFVRNAGLQDLDGLPRRSARFSGVHSFIFSENSQFCGIGRLDIVEFFPATLCGGRAAVAADQRDFDPGLYRHARPDLLRCAQGGNKKFPRGKFSPKRAPAGPPKFACGF